jgi:hypothetical protein
MEQIAVGSIPTAELLEADGRLVPKYLATNVPSSLDADASTDHLKGRPVLVLDEVSDKARRRLFILLIGRIGYPGDFRDELVAVGSRVNQFNLHRFLL